MKKLISLSTVFVLLFLVLSCSKDSTNPSAALVTTPEADATEDASSGGVYKGAFVGSSGVVKVTLQKGKFEVIITLDGVSKTLTTTGLANWKTGQAVANVDFTNGDWKATFNVSASGSSPTIIIVIPGHASISTALVKENSTTLVKAYEGTYEGTDSGNFNFVIKGDQLLGVVRSADGSMDGFYGTVSGNTVTIQGAGAVGTINGNSVSGTWQDTQNAASKGTWKGTRTL